MHEALFCSRRVTRDEKVIFTFPPLGPPGRQGGVSGPRPAVVPFSRDYGGFVSVVGNGPARRSYFIGGAVGGVRFRGCFCSFLVHPVRVQSLFFSVLSFLWHHRPFSPNARPGVLLCPEVLDERGALEVPFGISVSAPRRGGAVVCMEFFLD